MKRYLVSGGDVRVSCFLAVVVALSVLVGDAIELPGGYDDSGTFVQPITYAAYPGERPV